MANLNMNKVILGGRLTATPELKTTQSGIMTVSFTVAVNRRYTKEGEQQQADFVSCVAWRQTAEFISKYFGKGSSICVVGAIQTRTWQDQNGNKRYATELVVDEAYFVDGKNDAAPSDVQSSNAPSATVVPQFEELADGEDLPF